MIIVMGPVACAGDRRAKVLKDGWITMSADGSLTAYYESTILIIDEGFEVLTQVED